MFIHSRMGLWSTQQCASLIQSCASACTAQSEFSSARILSPSLCRVMILGWLELEVLSAILRPARAVAIKYWTVQLAT